MTEKADVFKKIKQDEQERAEIIKQRNIMIEQSKRRDIPEKKRLVMLKEKAKKAQKFMDSSGWVDFQDYMTDLDIEFQIRIRELGLKGKSSEDIGNEVIRLASMSEVISRILSEPKDLVKLLK